jgi:hypothetical protein
MNWRVLSGGRLHRFWLSTPLALLWDWGTNLKQIFVFPKPSWNIWRFVSQLMSVDPLIFLPFKCLWLPVYQLLVKRFTNSFGLLRTVRWWVFTDVSGQPIRPIFKGRGSTAWPLQMEPKGRPVTQVSSHQHTLRRTQTSKGLVYKQWKPEILQLSPDFEPLTALHFLHNI